MLVLQGTLCRCAKRTWMKYGEHRQTASKRGGVFLLAGWRFGGTLLAEDGVIDVGL
jgi:hypothetical protein